MGSAVRVEAVWESKGAIQMACVCNTFGQYLRPCLFFFLCAPACDYNMDMSLPGWPLFPLASPFRLSLVSATVRTLSSTVFADHSLSPSSPFCTLLCEASLKSDSRREEETQKERQRKKFRGKDKQTKKERRRREVHSPIISPSLSLLPTTPLSYRARQERGEER